jgi:serine O-acetyltransferase
MAAGGNSMQGRMLVWSLNRGLVTRKLINLVLRCDFFATAVGPNLRLPHPIGVVVHSRAAIGRNVVIYQNVTVGVAHESDSAPRIGDGVLVGAGAVILGPVVIGRGAKIGANSVVLADVPDWSTVVGVPARVVRRGRPS